MTSDTRSIVFDAENLETLDQGAGKKDRNRDWVAPSHPQKSHSACFVSEDDCDDFGKQEARND